MERASEHHESASQGAVAAPPVPLSSVDLDAEPTASSLADLRQTAESVVEVAADSARSRRTEDSEGKPAPLAGGFAADVSAVEAVMQTQLRRLLVYRHAVRQRSGGATADPLLSERRLCELVCFVALCETDAARTSSKDAADEPWLHEAVIAVADALSGHGLSSPPEPELRPRVAQLVNVARGTVPAAEDQKQTPAAVASVPAPISDPSRAAATGSAPAEEFIRTWSAKPFDLETTGLNPSEADFIMTRFDLRSRPQGRARLRLFLEAMRRNATLSSYVPPAEQQWASRCPFRTTPRTARMPSVTSVDRHASSEWNVTQVAVVPLPCRWWPEGSSRCPTQYRILATDLNGHPLFVSDMRETKRDAFLHFLATAAANITGERITPTFVAPPEMAGDHPRLMTVLKSYSAEQAAMLERLLKPAKRLARELEEVFQAVCDPPPGGFGSPAVHTDAIRELANIICEVFTENARRHSPPKEDRRRRRR